MQSPVTSSHVSQQQFLVSAAWRLVEELFLTAQCLCLFLPGYKLEVHACSRPACLACNISASLQVGKRAEYEDVCWEGLCIEAHPCEAC